MGSAASHRWRAGRLVPGFLTLALGLVACGGIGIPGLSDAPESSSRAVAVTPEQAQALLQAMMGGAPRPLPPPPGGAADCSRPATQGSSLGSAMLDQRFARALRLGRQGLFEESDRLLLDMLCAFPDAESKVEVMRMLAHNRGEAGDLEAGLVWIERAVEVSRLAPEAAEPSDLYLAGEWLLRLGDRDRARQKMAALEGWRGQRGSEQALLHLAQLRLLSGDVAGSRDLVARWEPLGRRRPVDRDDPETMWVGRAVAELALAQARAGHPAEAGRLGEIGLRLTDIPGSSFLGARAIVYRALALASLDRGEGQAAQIYVKEALALEERQRLDFQREMRGTGAERMGGTAEEYLRFFTESVPYLERAELGWLSGRALAQSGDPRGAVRELARAVDIVEHLRAFIDAGDRLRHFARWAGPYQALVETLLALEGTATAADLGLPGSRGRTALEQAFFYAEASRGRWLGELIARGRQAAARGKLPEPLVARERELVASAQADLRAGIPYERSPAYQALQQFIDGLRRSHPEVAAVRYPAPVAAGEVPLRAGEVLLEYSVLDRGVAVWRLEAGRPARVFRAPVAREPLLAALRALRQSLEPGDDGRLRPFDRVTAERLFAWLLAAPLEDVAAGSRVIIVPDGPLAWIPFEVLGSRGPRGEMQYAGDRFRFSYYPSASIFALQRRVPDPGRPPGPAHLLALGDPVFDERDPRARMSADGTPPPGPRLAALRAYARREGAVSFSRLRWTADELGAARVALGATAVDLRLGLEATEHAVRSRDLSGYRYLHFATHGVLAGDLPYLRQPALVLSQVGDLRGEDGFLTMGEVAALDLRAELAVLSACQTALGEEIPGEGVVGLMRAFLLAGSRSVVVSLWKVDDESTARLMGRLYRQLAAGLSPAAALAEARKALRAEAGGRFEHPFYWAPFVLFGGAA